MRTCRLVLLALQIAIATCYGQVTVKLKDTSPKLSPVDVSGVLLADDEPTQLLRYSNHVEGYLRNKSGKDIMLVILQFRSQNAGATAIDLTYQKEYFFGLDVLRHGEREPFRSSLARFGEATVNGRPIPKNEDERGSDERVTAEAMFVQFADGTSWGDPEIAQDAFIEREKTVRELDRLEQVLRNDGEFGLSQEFSKEELMLPCIDSLRVACTGKGDSCLADGLHSMIEAARHHQIEMKLGSGDHLNEISRQKVPE